MSSFNPFSCKIQIFKVRVKVSYFYETLKILNDFSWENHGNDFSWENHGHGGHEDGVHRGVLGGKLSFKKMSAAGRLCTLQETPMFGSRRSKLDHLTVTCKQTFWFAFLIERSTTSTIFTTIRGIVNMLAGDSFFFFF